jgi:transposase
MCVAAKGRGFIAGGRKGVLYFYDPPEPSAKRCVVHLMQNFHRKGVLYFYNPPEPSAKRCVVHLMQNFHRKGVL